MSIKLNTIDNIRTRNLVRGVLSAADYNDSFRAMVALRKEANENDVYKATKFLLTSVLASRRFRVQPFPRDVSDVRDRHWYPETSLNKEGAAQRAIFELSETLLLGWIDSIASINESFARRDSKKFQELIVENVETYGYSLAILQKVLSAKYSLLATSETQDFGSLLSPFMKPRKDLLYVAFEDSISWDKNYIRARRTFYKHVKKHIKGPYRFIIADIFCLPQGKNTAQVLQAYGRWSAGDALAYLERQAQHEAGSDGDPTKYTKYIPDKLHNVWQSRFREISCDDICSAITDEQGFEEYRAFPHAPAWSEYNGILKWRIAIETNIGQRLSGIFPARRIENTSTVPTVRSVEELLPVSEEGSDGTHIRIPIRLGTCGKFHRTVALTTTIDNSNNFTIQDGNKLLKLLDSTVDVALLLSVEDINKVLPERTPDRLYTYLRSALLFDSGEGRRAQHAHRRAVQEIVQRDFNGDIVAFAKFLDESCCHVANYLYHTCSEHFLTELYRLYPNAEQVAAAQIAMHKWYGAARDETAAIDLARTLELNLRLRAIRGSIDDTRLYVDPLRFQEWVLENLSSELRGFVQLKETLSEQVGTSVDPENKIDVLQSDYHRYVQLLNRAYQEFCTNKFYGVDSYLGRRIRHGTLSGVLVDELRPAIESAIVATRNCAPAFGRFLSSWSLRLSKDVDDFGAFYLYFRSKDKPKGMLSAQANAPSKINEFNQMAGHVLSSLGPTSPVNSAAKVIYEYCWILLECDLRGLRTAVQVLYDSLALDAASLTRNLDESTSHVVSSEIRKINASLRERFEKLGEWLTRPTSMRPSASFEQLIQVVLEEVGGRYSGFDPEVDLSQVDPIDLLGHRFHMVYDILYVLVDNAAKHGARKGQISFGVRTLSTSSDENFDIQLSVSSEILEDEVEVKKNEIHARMIADIDDALIQHGKSGLRKARLLVMNNNELSNFSVSFENNVVTFTADLRLRRERGVM